MITLVEERPTLVRRFGACMSLFCKLRSGCPEYRCKCREELEAHAHKLVDCMPDELQALEAHFVCPQCVFSLTRRDFVSLVDSNTMYKVCVLHPDLVGTVMSQSLTCSE